MIKTMLQSIASDIIILFLPIKHYDNSFDVEFGTKYLTPFFSSSLLSYS